MLLGAVLAGGRSTRFGSDKAQAVLAGRTLVAHAVSLLRTVADDVVVCGRAGLVAGVPSIPDRPRADLGPLGGLCAALRHGADRGFAAVVTIGCDTPDVPQSLLARLALQPGAAYLRKLPILGRWPVEWAGLLEARLAADDNRRVRDFAAAIGADPLESDETISNLNRAEDLVRLARTGSFPG